MVLCYDNIKGKRDSSDDKRRNDKTMFVLAALPAGFLTSSSCIFFSPSCSLIKLLHLVVGKLHFQKRARLKERKLSIWREQKSIEIVNLFCVFFCRKMVLARPRFPFST